MATFVEQHADKIVGTLSCFDRVLIRGYLPLESGGFMADFLRNLGITGETVKAFLVSQAKVLTDRALELATATGRPHKYLTGHTRMEEEARALAEQDGVQEGLVCVFSILEPCRSFTLRWRETSPCVQSAKRKCLFLYYYFVDREMGLIHVKIQTWFPFRLQVYVNGHEWLARKLDRHGVKYLKHENAFLRVEDLARVQSFSDRFVTFPWVKWLSGYAQRVNPLLGKLLGSLEYYWATAQAEYSTDILFKSHQALNELMPRLVEHSLVCLNANDVMAFLGRKLVGNFKGEIVSDLGQFELKGRLPGRRIKHRMKANWIKMYDKFGVILRIETVINQPEEFKVRRRVTRKGKRATEWVPMRKGVHWLFRYRDVSLKCNLRYLNTYTQVADPSAALRQLDRISTRRRNDNGRTVPPFNPLAHSDQDLFRALLAGEHCIHGFSNRELRAQLHDLGVQLDGDERQQAARVSRLLARFHFYGLVAKVPRSRRWRVSAMGMGVMSTALRLRHDRFAPGQIASPAVAA